MDVSGLSKFIVNTGKTLPFLNISWRYANCDKDTVFYWKKRASLCPILGYSDGEIVGMATIQKNGFVYIAGKKTADGAFVELANCTIENTEPVAAYFYSNYDLKGVVNPILPDVIPQASFQDMCAFVGSDNDSKK